MAGLSRGLAFRKHLVRTGGMSKSFDDTLGIGRLDCSSKASVGLVSLQKRLGSRRVTGRDSSPRFATTLHWIGLGVSSHLIFAVG